MQFAVEDDGGQHAARKEANCSELGLPDRVILRSRPCGHHEYVRGPQVGPEYAQEGRIVIGPRRIGGGAEASPCSAPSAARG